jgi:oxygen-dependent protoporphyrinogen oxidase
MSIIKETNIAVIGAGLTGLTLAHNLKRKGRNFLVIERSPKIGGVIQTVEKDGFTYERGPNTGVIGNDFVPQLFDELDGLCKLEVAGNAVKKRYVLKNEKWEPLPAGLLRGISTPLFTFGDKLRLLGEPFRKPGTNPNETLDQLVKRRMGSSFLNYAVDPFILGVYAGDPAYLVPKYALPKLYNLEQKYGSFIGGTVKLAKEKKKLGIKSRATREIFSTYGGLHKLIEALGKSAGEDNFLTNVEAIKVTPVDSGFEVTGTINGENIIVKAKRVVTTTGAHEVGNILPFIGDENINAISNLLYAKVVQVSLGFKNWDGMLLDGFGGLIPHRENRDILGVLFPSAFFPERAPQGGALLSVFMGGVRNSKIFDFSDAIIQQVVKNELCSLMGIKDFDPEIFQISRYRQAIPQYGADCEARFAAVEEVQKKYPGLFIAGNLRNGIGMADRIKQGYDIADEL